MYVKQFLRTDSELHVRKIAELAYDDLTEMFAYVRT